MVYLLHFSRPYEHVRHYVGVARCLEEIERIVADPSTHTRSPLLRRAQAAGITFALGRTWLGGDARAAQIRYWNNNRRYCDACILSSMGIAAS